MNKKILILPAIQDHVEAVKIAQRRGFEVITCDNLPSNPAHSIADKSFNIDLIDYESVIDMARKEEIDAVWAYSTDIGALTAAKITDALKINGNSFKTIQTMVNKSIFREFLKVSGFNYPNFKVGKSVHDFKHLNLNLPVIVKPVDRASSKGVRIVDNIDDIPDSIEYAKSFSLDGNVIVEEIIESEGYQIHGDAIICNGKLLFFEVGDQFFPKEKENIAPIGTVLPTTHNVNTIKKLRSEVIRFIQRVGYKNGGVNIEARLNKNGSVFLIEVAPRSGGNYIPELLSHYCGIDIKDILLSAIVNRKVELSNYKKQVNTFQFIWRAKQTGKLKRIEYSKQLSILAYYPISKIGDIVSHNAGTNNIIAIFIIRCSSRSQVDDVFNNSDKYFQALIEICI